MLEPVLARNSTHERARLLGRWLCLAGASLGALGLIGWLSGIGLFYTLVPGAPPMMPNTALGLLLIGGAGALRHRERAGGVRSMISLVGALIAVVIGLGTLVEYALAADLHLDRLLFRVPAGPYPGRPSPPTALALVFLSAALLLDFRPTARVRASESLVLCAALVAITSLTGIVLGAGPLYWFGAVPVVGVALPTGVGLILLSAGLLLERPATGLMGVVTSPGPGGVLLRRLIPPAVVGPVVLGLLVRWSFSAFGIDDISLLLAVLVSSLTVLGLLMLIITAVPLNRANDALESIRVQTRNLVEQAPDGIFVADLDGNYTDVNDAGCRMLGYSRDAIVGTNIVDLIPTEEADRLRESREQLLKGTVDVSEWSLRHRNGRYVPVEVSARILPDGRWQGFVRDITDRKRLEEQQRRIQDQIRQSEERFELALKGANLAAWDWNVKTGEVLFNARWAQMRGFRPGEVAPHVDSWISGVHPEDWPRVQQTLTDHFQNLIPEYETEHRVRTRSGQWIWVLDRGKVFARDEEGRPARMVGTELEITERKRLQEALRLSEARASGILSISADAIISIDEDQRITLFNNGAERIFGYSKSEAMGEKLDLLIPHRFRAIHGDHVERFAAGRQTARRMGERNATIFGLRKSGEEFPADAAISKLELGDVRVLTVSIRDVTDEKRIEKEQRFLAETAQILATTLQLEETKARLAELTVRELADFCIVDIVSEDTAIRGPKVASRDPARSSACEPFARILADRERPEPIRSVLTTRKPILITEVTPEVADSWRRHGDAGGALLAFNPRSIVVVPLVARDELLGVLALVSSTGGRLYGPADLRLAEELAHQAALFIDNARLYGAAGRAIRARDDVLGIVAHDLRNPLNAILMQAGTLRRHADEPERHSKSGEVIERAAIRMNRLIQDLLDVTRIEAGTLSIEVNRIRAEQAVSDCVEAQKPLASSASLELRLDIAHGLSPVWADRDRLLQVFENLVGNAIKFTGPGGRITVGAAPRANEVLFWVADTGPGIPAEDVPRVFDRFWQAQRAGRLGAGLGLPIVKGIIDAHRGRVWVESAPGRGSTFFFTIPMAREAAAPRAGPAPHVP